MFRSTILIGEKDEILRQKIKLHLSHQGFKVEEASEKASIVQSFQYKKPDLIIIGFSLNDECDGLEIVEHIRKKDRNIPLILITKYSSEDRVIRAFRAGINDYFKLPISFEELLSSIKSKLSDSIQRSFHNKEMNIPNSDKFQPMIGESKSMQEIKTRLLKVAATDTAVLITGETGTGKELVAEMIHTNSPNSKKPLVCINCSALPETLLESELFGFERGAFTGAVAPKRGKFELANGSTVFLDEIGDMSLYTQAKILRAIEKKEIHHLGGEKGIPINVRVISATNQDLEQMVSEGKFRKDLYYRLNVVRIHLNPLRNRKEDIPPLLRYYTKELNKRFIKEVNGFTEEAMLALLNYDWPGNIRELRNLLEATFVNLSSNKIDFIDLPERFRKQFKEIGRLSREERDQLLSALFATKWNKCKAAKKLRWSRMTLYRKMDKYHIISFRPKDQN